MSSEYAIQVDGVGKCFHIYANPAARLGQAIYPRASSLVRRLGGKALADTIDSHKPYRQFWALQDVSFQVRRGETFGIVGRNGSGKSTLLQIIAGTLSPTLGAIDTHGRIAALLELGSGFNPEFTGLENVRFNAAVLGLTAAEIDSRLDAILAFADIGQFVNQPVKTYSSGMVVRLAFAVQAQIEPDILIVDEALAVGDAKFQSKCFARLDALKQAGTSILFVSHATDQVVTHCDRALLLHDGTMRQLGAPKDVVHTYLDLLFGGNRCRADPADPSETGPAPRIEASQLDTQAAATSGNLFATRLNYNPYEFRWGDGAAAIEDFRLVGRGGEQPAAVECGEPLKLVLGVAFLRDVERPIIGITIKTKDGITVYGTNSEMTPPSGSPITGRAGTHAQISFSFDCRLGPGDYFISVGIASRDGEDVIPHDRRYDSIHLYVVGKGFFGLTMLDAALAIESSP